MKTSVIQSFAVLFTLITIQASGQSYYPAGLGNSKLNLWLTASDPTTILKSNGTQAGNGNFVATWKDKSGSGANATQATNGSQPIYSTNQLNGFGGVLFQNDNEYLAGPSGAYQTIVTVRSMPGTGHYQYLFSSPANQDFSIRGGGASSVYADGPNSNDWTIGTGSTPTQWINGVQSMAGSNTNHILVSAAAGPTNATYSISNVNASAAWGGRGMNGNDPVYELLSYDTILNTTQRHLLENYEGAEWGQYSLLPTSGYTLFTPPSPTTFNRNLVGVGYTSAADNFLTNPAGSTDGFGFSSGSGATDFLNTAGYLMAAHNGQANTTITNATIPGIGSSSSLSEWNRSWNLQVSGGNGTGLVTLNFNFSDYNGTTPNATFQYSILYNATSGTFATGTNQLITTGTPTVSGNIVSFKVNAANLPNGYYTIIYSTTPIVLPVTLTGFQAEKQQDNALLGWSVSDGAGIDHFDVERSTDGAHFSTIGTVAAPDDHSLTENYTYTDMDPAKGTNYYRLGMIGASGIIGYSDIIPVSFDDAATTAAAVPVIYPNPVADVMYIHMTAVSTTATDVHIFTLQGQVVAALTSTANAHGVDVPVNNLRTGIYIVEINTGGKKYISKMMKQ